MQSEYHHKKFGKSRSELVGGELTRQGPSWNLENYEFFFFKLSNYCTLTLLLKGRKQHTVAT